MSNSATVTVRHRQLWMRYLGWVDAHLANSGCAPIRHCIGVTSVNNILRCLQSVGDDARQATNRSSIMVFPYSFQKPSLPCRLPLDLDLPKNTISGAYVVSKAQMCAEILVIFYVLHNFRAQSLCH